MRRTISARCSNMATSRRVTRSSTSRADRVVAHGVHAHLVALEGLQRLIGPGDQPLHRVEHVLLVVAVDRDHGPVLGHRDDRDIDRAGHPLRSAVPGAGLRGGHVGIGHQMDVGPGDAGGVGRQDDGAVHLGQLRQPLGTELGVEQEAAGADVQDLGAVAHDDQRTHAGLEDPVDPLPERPTGRHRASASIMAALGRLSIGQSYLPSCELPGAYGPMGRIDGYLEDWVAMLSASIIEPLAARPADPGGWRPDPVASVPLLRRNWSRPMASTSVPTRTTSSGPAGTSADRGTKARRKPSRAASASRRGVCDTCRSSPARPISPQATRSVGKRVVERRRGQRQCRRQVGAGLGTPARRRRPRRRPRARSG